MKIYSSEKVIKVYVDVITDVGDFRVYPDGKVLYWDYDFCDYPEYEDYFVKIQAEGFRKLGETK
jgi:hypothetical protein